MASPELQVHISAGTHAPSAMSSSAAAAPPPPPAAGPGSQFDSGGSAACSGGDQGDGDANSIGIGSLFQGPAHDAGVFYNQIHDEIKALRSRVDQKLQDMISGGRDDIESLNKQVMSLKSTTSSEGDSNAATLPAVELVAGKVRMVGGVGGVGGTSRDPGSSSMGTSAGGASSSGYYRRNDDNSSFGDLRVSASAATEQATNLTSNVGTRKMRYYSNQYQRTGGGWYRDRHAESYSDQSEPDSGVSGVSGVSERDDEDEQEGDNDDEEDSSEMQYELPPHHHPHRQQQQNSQTRLRPERQKINNRSRTPPYSPNDAVAAARHATQDDAVTNARYGRASPPRRRFFPEDPLARRRLPAPTAEGAGGGDGGTMSAMAASGRSSNSARSAPQYASASEISRNGQQINPSASQYDSEKSEFSQPAVAQSQSSSHAEEDDDQDQQQQRQHLDNTVPLGRTASDVQRSIFHKPVERLQSYLSRSPQSPTRDAPELDRDDAPDPAPTAEDIQPSRSFKYQPTNSAAASSSASTTASDHFEIVVPSNKSNANMSTRSRVSGLSVPPELHNDPVPPPHQLARQGLNAPNLAARSGTSNISYPAEVEISPPNTGRAGADSRSEANFSTKSRISGLSQSSEYPSDPQADELLKASLEFLEESRLASSDHQQQRQRSQQQHYRDPSVAGRSRRSEMSGPRSVAISDLSMVKSSADNSHRSGLRNDEVDLLKASLAYLKCDNHLPTSPPRNLMPEQRRLTHYSNSGEGPRQGRQTPTRQQQQRGYGEDQRRQAPSQLFQQTYLGQQQRQYTSLPEHLRPLANHDTNHRPIGRNETETTAVTSYTKSRKSSYDLCGAQAYDEQKSASEMGELFDWAGDQSVSHMSYASKSIADKSENLVKLASSSVTENLEVESEFKGDANNLLALIEKEVGGTGGVVRVEKVQNHPIIDPYGDKGRYTGLLVKGKPYGHGSMHYDDGRSYTGEWKNGRWNGKGRTLFVNGDFYVGEYMKDQRHGLGRYEWSDGRVYDGHFKIDRREGKGTYSWPDGAIYTGDFKNGHRHGQGCYKFKDGSVYTGEFRNGKYHGVGECVWADGRCYRGEWSEGHAHGYGVEMRLDGTIRHDGEWRKDRPIRKSKEKDHVKKFGADRTKGCKMPEGRRKERKIRPTPGSSPRTSIRPISPTRRRYCPAIDP